MNLGIGTDIVEVDRIASAIKQHGARFAQRISDWFIQTEIRNFYLKIRRKQNIARP